MKLNIYIISKYWNKFAYFIAGIGIKMVWDYTHTNADILSDDPYAKTTREILTFTGK